jgi:hypothetical protein
VIWGVHAEVLIAGGYSLFLAGAALVLELLARHSHRRTMSIELAGFQYHHEHDAWECPTGQHLMRIETNHQWGVARYRAPAHICNCCGIKKNCTDSDEGRLIERPLESWIDSEIRRFHRGVSMALLVLAAVILAAEIFLVHRGTDRLLLAGVLAPIGAFGAKLISEFWGHATQKG